METAVVAWLTYEPGVEPRQWSRHYPSGRRRPDGDPKKEYLSHS